MTTKLSISLPDESVAALDEFAQSAGLSSRSAAVQAAIRRLGDAKLVEAYEQAWDEWEASGEEAVWSGAIGDGIDDAAR